MPFLQANLSLKMDKIDVLDQKGNISFGSLCNPGWLRNALLKKGRTLFWKENNENRDGLYHGSEHKAG